jgi:RNA polymerase sigma-70 factor (ECF subfamily)
VTVPSLLDFPRLQGYKRPAGMSTRSDEDLLRAAGGGDARSFRALVERYSGELYGYFRRRAGEEAAEDLLQETLIRLHRAAPRFVPQSTFRTFLYTIARNLALNHLRDRRPSADLDSRPAPAARGPSPSESIESDERARTVRRAVEGLSDALRDVVLLRHYQGLSFREIAAILEIPDGTAMRRMADAHVRLRENLHELP